MRNWRSVMVGIRAGAEKTVEQGSEGGRSMVVRGPPGTFEPFEAEPRAGWARLLGGELGVGRPCGGAHPFGLHALDEIAGEASPRADHALVLGHVEQRAVDLGAALL